MSQQQSNIENQTKDQVLAKAVFAGGCFWCIEAPMQRLIGVSKVISGYLGGQISNPSYQQICSGMSGHAEAVSIDYNPKLISYQQLLEIFFVLHDPTQLNKQGNDQGTQYRSAIFYLNDEQFSQAQQTIKALDMSGNYSNKIVTTLEPYSTFYPADEQHQHYFEKHPYQPYCQIIIAPKLRTLAHLFANKLK